MLCKKCKNPIEESALACEWCGTSISNNAPEAQKNTENSVSTLDMELLALLEKGEKEQAVKLYKERTGAEKDICRYKVARLDFFRRHQYATEETWNGFVKRSSGKFWIFRIIQFCLLIYAIVVASLAIENFNHANRFARWAECSWATECTALRNAEMATQHATEGWLGLLLSLFIFIPVIFWMFKTKRI